MFIFQNNIVLFHFLISVVLLFKSVVASAGTLKVTDATNSKLYQGPKNPRRSDLSSYILRKSDKSTQKPPKYFTGSPKPVWDELPSKFLVLRDRFVLIQFHYGEIMKKKKKILFM